MKKYREKETDFLLIATILGLALILIVWPLFKWIMYDAFGWSIFLGGIGY